MVMRFYAAFMYLSLICPLLCCTGHGSKIEQIADTLQLKGLGYYDTLVQIECPIAYNSFSINHVIKHTRLPNKSLMFYMLADMKVVC